MQCNTAYSTAVAGVLLRGGIQSRPPPRPHAPLIESSVGTVPSWKGSNYCGKTHGWSAARSAALRAFNGCTDDYPLTASCQRKRWSA